MNLVCEKDQCAGCMACVDICPKSCITIKDDIEHMNALIDENDCIHCNACHRVCQQNHPAELQAPVAWYQGWAKDEIRNQSSSGGFASAIEKAFVEGGGVVASCKFIDGDFKFDIARTAEELEGFAGSKYVKSNPVGIYKKVKTELAKGTKVLFLGLPCQVSSMKNFVGPKFGENLYTIDLICHGTPSIKLLRMAMEEYGYDLDKCKQLYFRSNVQFGLRTDIKKIAPYRVLDLYLTLFLNGGGYTENCYSCHYAGGSRVSDITLGDSWGSEFKDEESKGISLALIQTKKGQQILDAAKLDLRKVDLQNAINHNLQLQHPSVKDKSHDIFFKKMKKENFKDSVKAAYPKTCLKQSIKAIVFRFE